MSWFKRNKEENILGESGTIGIFIPPHLSENERQIVNEFGKARHIIHTAESMYLRGIEDGAEATIDIAIKQLERVKQLANIQKPTDEDVIRVMTEQVKDVCIK